LIVKIRNFKFLYQTVLLCSFVEQFADCNRLNDPTFSSLKHRKAFFSNSERFYYLEHSLKEISIGRRVGYIAEIHSFVINTLHK